MRGFDRPARAGQMWRAFFLLLLLPLFLAGCTQEEGTAPAVAPSPQPVGPTATPFVLPTLFPTATRPARQSTATVPPLPTSTAGPTVDLEQQLVSFRYTIPALGLDRRLEGNVSGTVTVVDETTGLAAILRNQGGVLLELQQALPGLELASLPDDCERCVRFSFALPLDGLEREGWLQEPVMLASVENYLALTLGPHFPQGTVVGLHRRATPYEVAHSLALTADGELWRWLATSAEVAAPEPAGDLATALQGTLAEIPMADLAGEYAVDCPGTGVEQLGLNPAGEAVPAQEDLITIICPAFSLPTSLLPLYTQLDGLLAETVSADGMTSPPPAIPLETLLAYRRSSSARLFLLQDGAARAEDPAGEVYTRTLGVSQVLSLTVPLQENEALQPGVGAYAEGEGPYTLLVRTPQGMAEVAWVVAPPEPLAEPVAALDLLLDNLLGVEPAPTATLTATAIITANGTLTPTGTTTP